MTPHIAQLCLFLYFIDCYPAFRGPKFVAKLVSQISVFILGVLIGKWLLGFKKSYPEYYRKEIDQDEDQVEDNDRRG